ncbi:teichoic acid transport system ATP-binding protein [Paenibacillaceae bacterium GAS479]|nr:teichoic acid transport system ATP-binding protein [Paenibacillaceae bacterium GAS479]
MSYDPIVLKDISKQYKIYENPRDRLKQFLFKSKRYYKEFWALRNVSFEVGKGQTVGIIGKNGSGKSTLLQVITQTLQPTTGDLQVNGRVAALLELGSGFNPEFTGRENVYLNGAIMGLSQKEVEERFSSIEDFAEIGEFIDQPVKTYSSGMFVRLAFACAVNVDPEILIVDEALSVGDMQFQLKCMDKMKQFKKEGKTILFVSHDTYSIKNFCDEVIWMKNGQVYMRGGVQRVTDLYEDYMKAVNVREELVEENTRLEYLKVNKVTIADGAGNNTNTVTVSQDMTVSVEYEIKKSIDGIVGGVAIIDNLGTYVCGLNTKLDRFSLPSNMGKHVLNCHYEQLPLLPGTYFLDIGFFESSGLVRLDYRTKVASFTVSSKDYLAEGVAYLPHTWSNSVSKPEGGEVNEV